LADLVEANRTGEMVSGIKPGGSILNELKHYHPVVNTQIDTMHSLFYGVIKGLFRYWFDEQGQQSLKSNLDALNDRLLKIKPPR
jgi:hypothetical protein